MERQEDLVELDEVPELHYTLTGKGEYTFILESGKGDASPKWEIAETVKSDSVAMRLQALGRVFTYDRLGEGKSPNILKPDPIPAIETVNRLNNFLVKKQIKPPYILVGHSIGGLYMQIFAQKFPEKVAGVILIDPCVSPQMTATGWEEEIPDKYLTTIYCCVLKKHKINPAYCELIAQKQHASEKPFPKDIPLHVISAKHNDWGSKENKIQMDIWHKKLTRQSNYGTWKEADQLFAEYPTFINNLAHWAHWFQPKLVIESAATIIELNKNKISPSKTMLNQYKLDENFQDEPDIKLDKDSSKLKLE